MALTRHSARACFLWRERGDDLGRGTVGQQLWQPFLKCLEQLQDPASAANGSSSPDRSLVESEVKEFLRLVAGAAPAGIVRVELEHEVRNLNAVAELDLWHRKDRVGLSAARRLFEHPQDQGAVAFYLGQLAFLFGHLRLARACAVEAYELLTDVPGTHENRQPLSLRILKFLTVTLLLEVAFHSEGYDTYRDKDGEPQAWRIYVDLTGAGSDYLRGFPPGFRSSGSRAASPARRRAAKGTPDRIEDFLGSFWLPIPTDKDIEELPVNGSLPSDAFALAYVLSRQNRAGMLLFRYQDWAAAEQRFTAVLAAIDDRRHESGNWNAMLAPLEQEALLYLGRIEAQACKFESAERRIGEAERYFASVADEFALNKARKARAELKFRQCRWQEAEALFLQVWRDSRDKGFAHDRAAAEMARGKILSRFGFQADAELLFTSANEHFRRYDVLRESIECLFWHIVCHARKLDLTGHSRVQVVAAKALTQVYQKLFAAAQSGATSEELTRLVDALRDKRNPEPSLVMLHLRLGFLPSLDLVQSLVRVVSEPRPEMASWPLQGRQSHQLLRIIRLQSADKRPPVRRWGQRAVAREEDKNRLSKFTLRDYVLSALEGAASPHREGDLAPACRALQMAWRGAAELGLGGGLVPSLVDLSQYFVDRDSFVALLLLLLEAVGAAIADRAAPRRSRLDPEVLKAVYRSLTKYLVLERNFYLGPPSFRGNDRSALWSKLGERHPGRDWGVVYRSALKGEHGISYPTLAVALGWVESLGSGGASLRLLWVEECLGRPLQHEHFQRIEVPIEVVSQGHAERRMAPVVLIGRHGEPGDEGSWRRPWTAHRIPVELDEKRLFEDLESSPWYQPNLAAWQELLDRFAGHRPSACESPSIAPDDPEVVKRSWSEARRWFGDLLKPDDFRRVFGIEPSDSPAAAVKERRRAASSAPTAGEPGLDAPSWETSSEDETEDVAVVLKSFRADVAASGQPSPSGQPLPSP